MHHASTATDGDHPGDLARPVPVTIDPRFRGPVSSGNGGYTAGLLAQVLLTTTSLPDPHDQAPQAVEVTLRMPPPLGRPLRVETFEDGVRMLDSDALVGTAVLAELDPTRCVDAVSESAALAAEAAYRGLVSHPFPECFVCGTARTRGDGLALRPGTVSDGRTACTWRPDPSLADAEGLVRPEFVWAALDCPGGWTADLEGRPLVLGRMTACVDARPRVDELHVVTGSLLGAEGRKTFSASAVHDSDGRVVGRAAHTWIEIDPAGFA
ncbi:MAG: hypothetical protein ACRDP1_13690 [Nocardioidaceae bacterium]